MMQKKLEEFFSAMEDYMVGEEDYTEKLDQIAHDIANLALDHFNGEELKKAIAIAVAIADFTYELERE
jgi:hypothetical protein